MLFYEALSSTLKLFSCKDLSISTQEVINDVNWDRYEYIQDVIKMPKKPQFLITLRNSINVVWIKTKDSTKLNVLRSINYRTRLPDYFTEEKFLKLPHNAYFYHHTKKNYFQEYKSLMKSVKDRKICKDFHP